MCPLDLLFQRATLGDQGLLGQNFEGSIFLVVVGYTRPALSLGVFQGLSVCFTLGLCLVPRGTRFVRGFRG